MANPEHLKTLKQGVKAWNKWRKENPGVRPNLRTADLSEADLSRANLHNANLNEREQRTEDDNYPTLDDSYFKGANLRRTNLKGSNLGDSNLRWATLDKANLSAAILIGANFTNADLSGANLNLTYLERANFYGANLTEADLTDAALRETVFGDTNLSGAKGLESCKHYGPSTVDHRTLAKSGKLPLEFLRGVGLPDTLIDYLPSLLGEALQFYSCFISYSSKDQKFAERLHADLQDKGVRCWLDRVDLRIGDELRPAIDEAIRIHDKVLLILSEYSMKSKWVDHEVKKALNREIDLKGTVLFPIRVDSAVMRSRKGWAAEVRKERNIGDFTRWKDHDTYQKEFERLIRDLKQEPKRSKRRGAGT